MNQFDRELTKVEKEVSQHIGVDVAGVVMLFLRMPKEFTIEEFFDMMLFVKDGDRFSRLGSPVRMFGIKGRYVDKVMKKIIYYELKTPRRLDIRAKLQIYSEYLEDRTHVRFDDPNPPKNKCVRTSMYETVNLDNYETRAWIMKQCHGGTFSIINFGRHELVPNEREKISHVEKIVWESQFDS